MSTDRRTTPAVVLIYGLLGVIPFLAPPLAGVWMPALRSSAALLLALYGGLILSFLGGARWGMAVFHPDPSARVVSLAMIPTLAGLALLVLNQDARRLQLIGLAIALAVHWLWDVSSPHLPAWYPRLRTILTTGAVIGLLSGAVVLA